MFLFGALTMLLCQLGKREGWGCCEHGGRLKRYLDRANFILRAKHLGL